MQPLYTDNSCLKCHSQQGYQVGDVRGGIGFTLPVDNEFLIYKKELFGDILKYVIVWLLGVIGISLGWLQLKISLKMQIESLEKLRQTQKLEALSTLAGGIAHDFNNILSVIIGKTELLKKAHKPGSEEDENYEQIINASRYATGLIGQILTFSKQKNIKYKPVLIAYEVTESLTLLRSFYPKHIEMKYNIQETDKLIMGDPAQIKQIILNLCTNASIAIGEESGLIEVELLEIEISKTSIIQNKRAGTAIKLVIRDTGRGIPEEIQEKIFEPYFTTNTTGQGTGLGLSVVQGIVRNMSGIITLNSHPGQGTTFEIVFPCLEK